MSITDHHEMKILIHMKCNILRCGDYLKTIVATKQFKPYYIAYHSQSKAALEYVIVLSILLLSRVY